MNKQMKDKLEALQVLGYKVAYATVDYGNGPLCAWCAKKNPTRFHIMVHDWIDRTLRRNWYEPPTPSGKEEK